MSSYIYVDGWKTKIRFSSAHLIPEYEKCGRLHGHTYAIHLKVFGEPDEKGIIVDFSVLKKNLREIIQKLDHMVLIPEKSSQVEIEKDQKSLKIKMINKEYVLPIEDCVLLPIESTSAEKLSAYILDLLIDKKFLPDSVEKIEIGVDEGYGQGARVSKNL